MGKRKHKLINKKFQLSLTFSIIKTVFLILAMIIAFIGINFIFNNQKLSAIIEEQKEITNSEDNIFKTLTHVPPKKMELEQRSDVKKIMQIHADNISTTNSHILSIEKIITYNYLVLLFVIIFFIILIFLLYFLLIGKTHRIYGPIDIMSEYINKIIRGEYPTTRPIRKNDELRDFYSQFSKMIDVLREREENTK